MSAKQLTLPALEHREKCSIGEIALVLRPQETQSIKNTESVAISPRRSADMFTLENGVKIVVVPSKIAAPPAGVEGVLTHNPSHTRWQWHAEIEDLKTFIAKNGWLAGGARAERRQLERCVPVSRRASQRQCGHR